MKMDQVKAQFKLFAWEKTFFSIQSYHFFFSFLIQNPFENQSINQIQFLNNSWGGLKKIR